MTEETREDALKERWEIIYEESQTHDQKRAHTLHALVR